MKHILNGSGPKNIKWVPDGETIQGVINSISDASATNPYTVMIPPGVFDENIVMKEYVSMVGATTTATTINSTTPLILASNTTLEKLTINISGNFTIQGTDVENLIVCNLNLASGWGVKALNSFEGKFYDSSFSSFETCCGSAYGNVSFFNCVIEEKTWASGVAPGFTTFLFNCNCGGLKCTDTGTILAYNCRFNATIEQTGAAGVTRLYGGSASGLMNMAGGELSLYGTVQAGMQLGPTTGDSKIFGKLNVSGIAEYADNTAALAGGLVAGDFYRTGDASKVVH